MGHINGKLRAGIDSNKGRSTGHAERTISKMEEHIGGMHTEYIKNKFNKINEQVKAGQMSKDTGDWLKKTIS